MLYIGAPLTGRSAGVGRPMRLPVVEVKGGVLRARAADYEDLKELVLALVQLVPIGFATTYGDIAKVLGVHPRLIGRILSENRHHIEIPCHRVVGVKGFGGYTLNGRRALGFKRRLLQLESKGTPKRFNLCDYLLSPTTDCYVV